MNILSPSAYPVVKKSVLLVDVHIRTRTSRAANLRKLGATVDCASSAASGLQQFGAGSYQLVLIDLGSDRERAEQLARDIRLKHPAQLVAFMVEGPALISKTLAPTASEHVPEYVAKLPGEMESAFGLAVRNAEQLQQAALLPGEPTKGRF